MILPGNAIVTDVSITILPAAPLHVFEIWSNPAEVGQRFAAATGFALPAMGKADGTATLRMIRYEPTVWLVEGGAEPLAELLGHDGALTEIGGGIVRFRLTGKGWRRLIMEGGVFDAEDPSFAKNCSAATVIDHVNVRLHVVEEDICDVYVPLSYSNNMLSFWEQAAPTL
jgi:heterotetrameric sarcosine oxidase gamma subunit